MVRPAATSFGRNMMRLTKTLQDALYLAAWMQRQHQYQQWKQLI
jgi:hypothetical protein